MIIVTIRFEGQRYSFNFGCDKFIADFVRYCNKELHTFALIEKADKPSAHDVDKDLIKEGIIHSFHNWKLANYYEV